MIVSFTLWTIFSEGQTSNLLRGMFLVFILLFAGSTILSKGIAIGFPILSIAFIGLAVYGWIIQRVVKSNPARIILSMFLVGLAFNSDKLPIFNKNILSTEYGSSKLDLNNELILKCSPGKKEEVRKKLKKLSYVTDISEWSVDSPESTQLDEYLIVNITDDKNVCKIAQKLEEIKDITWIEANESWEVSAVESESSTAETAIQSSLNDPRIKDQWNFAHLNLDEFHNIIKSSGIKPRKPAKLFIVDSGVDFKHEDLRAALKSHPSMDQDVNQRDANGHGSHCAGVAGAVTNNGKGIASFNPGPEFVQLGSVAVLNRFGFATQAKIIEGIIEAVDAGADVINMSFGGLSNQLSEEAYDDVLKYAESKNVILIAAAGNSARDAAKYRPSGSDKVITVSALNKFNEKAQFSNFVNNTNYGIAAPGTSILSSYKGRYSPLDGTSMAAPHVAGLVAVLRSIRPGMTTAEAHRILDKTGTKTTDTKATGKMINPVKALKSVMD